MASASHVVTLDVGGAVYKTTRSTLTTRDSPNYFDGLLSGHFSEGADPAQPIFIDRDGDVFRYVLQYLRDGMVDAPLQPHEMRALQREADFFQLEGLGSQLEPQGGDDALLLMWRDGLAYYHDSSVAQGHLPSFNRRDVTFKVWHEELTAAGWTCSNLSSIAGDVGGKQTALLMYQRPMRLRGS